MTKKTSQLLIIGIILLTVFSCANKLPVQSQVSLNEEFILFPSDTVSIRPIGLIVKYVELVEDSLCPQDTECFWAGRLKVDIIINTTAYSLTTDSDNSIDIIHEGKKYKLSLENKVWPTETNPKPNGISLKATPL